MSFLGRLFGRSAPSPPPAPPANTVTIADDLAAELTAEGRPLADAVEAALREQIAARARGAESRMPFWLTREEEELDLEAELRDKLEKRRAAEGGAGDG
jgi:hypothetical protein